MSDPMRPIRREVIQHLMREIALSIGKLVDKKECVESPLLHVLDGIYHQLSTFQGMINCSEEIQRMKEAQEGIVYRRKKK